jgi:glycosyltransferase involved in cell wall biosynthesis
MESYSRVIMESWLHGRPVVVHEQCAATSTVVRETGGGLLAGTVSSWESVLYQLDVADAETLETMGERGRLHAAHASSWPRVIEAYERALGLRVSVSDTRPRGLEVIRQFSTRSAPLEWHYADALTRSLERAQVRSFQSDSPLGGGGSGDDDVPLVVHYTGGSDSEHLPERGAALIHHFDPMADERDEFVDDPRLATLAGSYHSGFGSTPTAVDALRAAGFDDAAFLPICVDPRDWDCDDDHPLANALQDGCTNLIYVGPFTNLEPLDQLLTAFLHYLTLDRDSRLVLIGTGAVDDTVYARMSDKVRSLDLLDRVLLARDITGPQMQSVYRCARVFWSLDEGHSLGEGFLQALWFDVPIIAFRTDVSASLVGDASLLVTDKSDLLAIATLAQMVVSDGELRRRILQAQRAVRERFDAERIVRGLLERLAPSSRERPASQAALER